MKVGARRGKGKLHSEGRWVPRRRDRASKVNLPRRSRRAHELVNGHKSFPGRFGKFWFYSKSGQT